MYLQPLRHILTKNLNNLRDIGGYPVDASRMVRWGRIFRCSGMFKADDSDWDIIRKLGIVTVIDLRSEKELQKKPVHCPEDLTYLPINMITEYDSSAYMKSLEGGLPMHQAYIDMCNQNKASIATTIELLTSALKKGNVIYFCYGGKDRTGILTALLHFILGVRMEDLISDYQVSYTHRALQYKGGTYLRRPNSFDRGKEDKNTFSDPETIVNVIEMFQDKDFIGELMKNGLSEQTMDELKSLLLVDYN